MSWRVGAPSLREVPRWERRVLEGQRVVLVGPVNAGKSSLFNALLGDRRALVDEQPGTTRDAICATLNIGGHRVTLYDTAGTRVASGLEKAGIDMGLDAARAADLAIWVEDTSQAPILPPSDLEVACRVENKSDLPRSAERAGADERTLRVSAKIGSGLEDLRREIAARLGALSGARSARQIRILREAAHFFGEATAGPDDLGAAALWRGADKISQLVASDSPLADEVYRRFCIGK
jgi:tRNA modification GTPase